jgi:DNA-binding transcriptional LysR family regulator
MSKSPGIELLRRLNLNQLLGFMTVAETRSFRSAAARIHISQSALSVQVRQLEEALGVPLFHRTTRSVTLTEEGRRLNSVARRVSAELSQVALELKEEAQLQRGVITVAVLPSLAAGMMPQAMREFAAIHPGIEIRLRDADSTRALELVRQGEADIGVLSRNDQLHGLRFSALFREDFLAVVPAAGHPLSGRVRVGARQLAAYPLLLNPRGVDTREALEAMFRAARIVPQPTQELIGTPALVSLVGAGFGVSVLPRMAFLGLDLARCRLLELREAAGREIGVVLSTKRSESPATVAFREFLEAAGARYGPGKRLRP